MTVAILLLILSLFYPLGLTSIFVALILLLAITLLAYAYKEEMEEILFKESITKIAAHQMRTPLTAIKWLSELLEEEKSPKERQKMIADINSAANRMNLTINTIEKLSNIKGDKVEITLQNTNLKEIIKSLKEELEKRLSNKKLKIKFNFDPKKNEIITDGGLLHQLLRILIVNSFKYSDQEGTVSIDLKVQKTKLKITVQDQGFGIPKRLHKKVFKKFYRHNHRGKPKVEGLGLGLYIAKVITDSLNGTIHLESSKDGGCTFQIELPIKKA